MNLVTLISSDFTCIILLNNSNTFQEIQGKSAQIWKFKRHALIEEYKRKPFLVPPFVLFFHLYLLLHWCYRKLFRIYKEEQGLLNSFFFSNIFYRKRLYYARTTREFKFGTLLIIGIAFAFVP